MIPPFTANQARDLSLSQRRGPVIAPVLDHVYTRIKERAAKGHTSLAHPLHGWRGDGLDADQQEAIWEALRAQGFKVTHHADPDPGHPASAPYDEVSWA